MNLINYLETKGIESDLLIETSSPIMLEGKACIGVSYINESFSVIDNPQNS